MSAMHGPSHVISVGCDSENEEFLPSVLVELFDFLGKFRFRVLRVSLRCDFERGDGEWFVGGVEVWWRGGEPPCTCTAAGKSLGIFDSCETRVGSRVALSFVGSSFELARVCINCFNSFKTLALKKKETEEIRIRGEEKGCREERERSSGNLEFDSC